MITQWQRFAGILVLGATWLLLPVANAQSLAGTKIWDADTRNRISSSPAAGPDGAIYVGAGNQLIAFQPSGPEKWRFAAQGAILSSPAVDENGRVYFGSLDHKLYVVTNGVQVGSPFTTDGAIYSSPTIDETGTIYVGSDDFHLYAIGANGKQKWSFATGGYVRSSPTLSASGLLYFGSFDSKVYAVDRNGNELWKFDTGHYVYSSPAIAADGTIYVGSVDKSLYALNPDGSKKWAVNTGGHIYSSPAIGPDGTIYIGSWDNRLHAVNPDGTLKWSFATGNLVQSAPAVGADGAIYFGSDENKIYAVSSGGNKLWSFTTGSLVRSSPLLTPQGIVYCGSEDNHLYAIRASSGPATSPWPMFRASPSHRGRVQLVITNQPPANLLVTVGHSATLSVSAIGAAPLYYQWQHNGTNIPGGNSSTLTFSNTQPTHAGQYGVVINNSLERLVSHPAKLTVVVLPIITAQPATQTSTVGATISFRTAADSAGPVACAWLFQGKPVPGETNLTLTLNGLALTHAGDYAAVLSNSAGAVTSAVAKLTVVAVPEITQQPQNQVSATRSAVEFSVAANSVVPVTYQWRLNGTNIAGATGAKLEIKEVEPKHGGSYTVVVNNQAGQTVSAAALLTVTMQPQIDTHPKNMTGVVDRAVSLGVAARSAGPLTYQWFFNNNAVSNATGNTLTLAKAQTNDAGNYFVVVSNVAGMATSTVASLTILVPPSLVTSPLSQTGTFGKSVVFKAAATGTPPLDYSWRFNETNLIATTNPASPVLLLTTLVPEQSGKYTVVVTNAAGAVTSAPAMLTVPRPLSAWEKAKAIFGGGKK